MPSAPTRLASVALVVAVMCALMSPAQGVTYPTCPKNPVWTGDLGCAKDSYGNYVMCDMNQGTVNFLGKTAEGNPVTKTNFVYQVSTSGSVYKTCSGSAISHVYIRLSTCCCVNLPALVDAGLAYASYCGYTTPAQMGHCVNSNSGWKKSGFEYSTRTENSGKDYDDGIEHTSWLKFTPPSAGSYLVKLTFNMKVDQDLGPNSLKCVNAGGQCGCAPIAGPDTCSIAKLLPKYYVKTPGDSCFKSVAPTTSKPTVSPTKNPTVSPTNSPTKNPTVSPTKDPTKDPTVSPTKNPTVSPTKNPTVTPTVSPTLSPTICKGPPPNVNRRDAAECQGSSNAIVNVNAAPQVTTNSGEGTTTLCYDYTLVDPNGSGIPRCRNVNSSPVIGVSFIIDECCPDKKMNFLAGVSVSSNSGSKTFGKDQCAANAITGPFGPGCLKVTRPCSSRTHGLDLCTVVNANKLSVGGSPGKYCVTISGVGYEAEPPSQPGQLKNNLKDTSKICFERGSPDSVIGAGNAQTCVDVDFPTSRELCQDTASPTVSPTKNPTVSPTKDPSVSPTKNPTVSPTKDPTVSPTKNPTVSPTKNPTKDPTVSPTKSPSASPTISPTLSPTPCSGPPPDYERGNGKQCGTEGSSNAIIEITNANNEPVVTTNSDEGTTTFCYDYQLVNPQFGQGCSGAASTALVGMSFVIDECCPDKKMQFVAGVSANAGAASSSFGKDECRLDGMGIGALSNGCVKARRSCNQASMTLRNQRCTVVNANGLGLSAMNGKYCITVSGVNYEQPGTNSIKPGLKQKSKICAERGRYPAGSSRNYQACVEVTFVDSQELCQDTASPTKNPTKNPTVSPTVSPTKNPTVSPTKNPTSSPTKDPTRKPSSSPTISPTQAPVCFGAAEDITPTDPSSGCTASCNFANSVWGVSLVSRTVVTVSGGVVTKFKYKISGVAGYASGKCPTTPIAAFAIRFDECCGQGFLQAAYNSGNVRFDMGGYAMQKQIVTGAAGASDYVLVSQTIFQTMSVYFTIIVKGNIPATAAGKACVKGSYPTTCACKPISTPNTCFIAGAVTRTARPTYYRRRRALAERLSG